LKKFRVFRGFFEDRRAGRRKGLKNGLRQTDLNYKNPAFPSGKRRLFENLHR
jgi:hypothetical protein